MHIPVRRGKGAIEQTRSASETRLIAALNPEDVRIRTNEPIGEFRFIKSIPYEGGLLYVYTTGVLEWLIEHNYDIIIFTPQHRLQAWDEWWLKLLPEHTPVITGPHPDDSFAPGADPVYRPWKEIFRLRGIENPQFGHTGEARDQLRELGVLFIEDVRHLMTQP
jgi:hypothetical protein